MADPPPNPDSREYIDGDTGIPRWVKVLGIIAAVLVLLFVIVLFAGGPGGSHGPGRHSSVTESGGVGGHAPLASGHIT